MDLGKFTEAEEVLSPSESSGEPPYGAPGLFLLGKMYQLTNRHKSAQRCFQQALSLDPLMWCAFEELCALGAEPDTTDYLKMEAPVSIVLSEQKNSATIPGASPASHNGNSQTVTPMSGPIGLAEQGNFETPDLVPQAMQPPPMKKGAKDSSFVPLVSPRLLEDNQLLHSGKFLDEGTVRKVCLSQNLLFLLV